MAAVTAVSARHSGTRIRATHDVPRRTHTGPTRRVITASPQHKDLHYAKTRHALCPGAYRDRQAAL
jgi:hypothetical protein